MLASGLPRGFATRNDDLKAAGDAVDARGASA
jgi:hypothetical protein